MQPNFYTGQKDADLITKLLSQPIINEEEGNAEPTKRIPLVWYNCFLGENFKYTERMIFLFRKIKEGLDRTREGTIGSYFEQLSF